LIYLRTLLSWVEDVLDLLESIRDTIPGFLSGIAGWLIGKLNGVIGKLIDLLEFLSDISSWTGLIHELAFHILHIDEIGEWLAKLFDIPLWTWENIIVKVFDGLRYILAMSVSHGDDFVAAIRDALLRAFDVLGWSFDTVKLLAISAVNELLESTDWLWERFVEHVWPRLAGIGGFLEDWLLWNAEWLKDTVLDLTEWAWGWLEGLSSLPTSLLEIIGWDILARIQEAGKDFILFLLEIAGAIVETIAQPIVDLGESILDYVWGDE